MVPKYDVAELAEAFRDIDRELVAASDVQEILDRLCVLAVDRIDGATWAGISQGRRGRFETPAATADVVRQVDAEQYRIGSGPCVDAMEDTQVLVSSNLREDPRWPEFGRAAAERGVLSMMSYRLFLEDSRDTIAALNFYSPETAAFDDVDETLAVLLATYGATALARANETSRADNLTVALKNSREIGIAVGVLMSTYRITRDEGFDILRMFSQRTHRKLADIAADVAETGALPELPAPRTAGSSSRPEGSARSAG